MKSCMRSKTTLQTPTLIRLVELIKTSPHPLTINEIRERMNFSQPYMRNLLWFARGNNLVDGVRDGKVWRWASVEVAAQIRPTASAAKARRAAREKQLRIVRLELRKKAIEEAEEVAIQRILPASEPLPFICNAPASVFTWGAML